MSPPSPRAGSSTRTTGGAGIGLSGEAGPTAAPNSASTSMVSTIARVHAHEAAWLARGGVDRDAHAKLFRQALLHLDRSRLRDRDPESQFHAQLSHETHVFLSRSSMPSRGVKPCLCGIGCAAARCAGGEGGCLPADGREPQVCRSLSPLPAQPLHRHTSEVVAGPRRPLSSWHTDQRCENCPAVPELCMRPKPRSRCGGGYCRFLAGGAAPAPSTLRRCLSMYP